MSIGQEAVELHRLMRGKIKIIPKKRIKTIRDLSLMYTPGVGTPCLEIAKKKELVFDYTARWNIVAVLTDGSAVLGLGNIGPEAGLPVMEGKAVLFKEFGGVDAFPVCVGTQDTAQIIAVATALAPSLGGINLEDISAPRCFEIEETLKKTLSIPGLPRRPARHRHRHPGGAHQCPAPHGQGERAGRHRHQRRGGGRQSPSPNSSIITASRI